MQRASLGSLGKLSQGIRIGHATGFDSGESLDYVYENKARGSLGLGQIIDYFYLNAIGWRGIRQRRACMNQALRYALQHVRSSNLPLQLMDVAGGAGRYLLDVLADPEAGAGLHVLCRDWSESALATGRATAQQMGLTDRIIICGATPLMSSIVRQCGAKAFHRGRLRPCMNCFQKTTNSSARCAASSAR
jgi:hypothetical protein